MIYTEVKTKQSLNNVYILQGDEYIVSTTIKDIANILQVGQINLSEFNDENFDVRAIVNACNQFSFFNEKRFVVVYPPEKEITAQNKQLLLSYISSPNLDCYLLLINSNLKFDFVKDVEIIDCKPSETSLIKIVDGEFKKYGKQINKEQIVQLISYCRGNLNRIVLEIKKICDFMQDTKIVNSQIIENMVAKDTELKVFDLTTYMAQKNVEKAEVVLNNMLKAGEPPIKILGLISNHFRRVFFAKINKGTNAELAQNLGCKEYAIVKAKGDSAKFTAKQLKDIQALILEADYNIKSGAMTQENALYYILMKICLIK